MKPIDTLSVNLKNILLDIKRAKQAGQRPGGYLSEELVIASDAINICLIYGGDRSAKAPQNIVIRGTEQ